MKHHTKFFLMLVGISYNFYSFASLGNGAAALPQRIIPQGVLAVSPRKLAGAAALADLGSPSHADRKLLPGMSPASLVVEQRKMLAPETLAALRAAGVSAAVAIMGDIPKPGTPDTRTEPEKSLEARVAQWRAFCALHPEMRKKKPSSVD